jgi:ABC-2 type transport system permease protein
VRTIRFLLAKEFRQIFRDRTMLRMLLIVPLIQLLVLSSAATFEVDRARLWVVDLDGSPVSRGLIGRLVGSGRFEVAGWSASMDAADRALLERRASAILGIPADFERDLHRQGTAPVQIILDAEDGAAAGVLQSYLTAILQDHAREVGRRIGGGAPVLATGGVEALPARAGPSLEVRHRGWYNPELDYHHYMVPGILVVLVTVVAMAITSMNIVREKEIGTLEQLSVTPVTRAQFVASKLIPFWLIALVDLGLGLILARLVFDIPVAGSLAVVAVSAVAYLFVALGIALWISTVVETQQQAMFIAFTVNMVYLLMSGLFTPYRSMPDWAQWVGQLSPVKHFIEIMRAVLVRGAGWEAVGLPIGVLAVYGAVVFTLAIRQFSKTVA